MKKLLYILICLPLIFSSCKKEDDSPNSSDSTNNSSASILGTWEIASSTNTFTKGYLDPIEGTEVVNSTETTSKNYPLDDGNYMTWTFASDGGITERNFFNDGADIHIKDLSYVKDGTDLYVGEGVSSEVKCTITTLTNSTLSFNRSVLTEVPSGTDVTFFEKNASSFTFNK